MSSLRWRRGGGGHDAHVHLHRVRAAQAHELALLHDAQQLGLGLQGDVADLVEEQRALVRQLEEALLRIHGAGEGALHVAEEVRLQEVVRERPGVDDDEGLVRARGVGVDGLGHQLLARSALADHEDGRARGRGLRDQAEHLLHARALAHDLGEAGLVLERAPQVAVLVLEPPLLQPVAQDVQHLFVLEGLGDVVEGALLHGLDGRLHGGESGDHQDDEVGIDLFQLLEHVQAAQLRQHDVHDGRLVGLLFRQGQSLDAVVSEGDAVARFLEQALQDVAHHLLVVDDEDVLGAHRRAASAAAREGSATWNVVPWPGTLSTKMAPPCSCTIPKEMERPRPVPRPMPFVVKKGS